MALRRLLLVLFSNVLASQLELMSDSAILVPAPRGQQQGRHHHIASAMCKFGQQAVIEFLQRRGDPLVYLPQDPLLLCRCTNTAEKWVANLRRGSTGLSVDLQDLFFQAEWRQPKHRSCILLKRGSLAADSYTITQRSLTTGATFEIALRIREAPEPHVEKRKLNLSSACAYVFAAVVASVILVIFAAAMRHRTMAVKSATLEPQADSIPEQMDGSDFLHSTKQGDSSASVDAAFSMHIQHHTARVRFDETEAIPHELICPITLDIFSDPVIVSDGHTYERRSIADWIRQDGRSPMTRELLLCDVMIPNVQMRQLVEAYYNQQLGSNAKCRRRRKQRAPARQCGSP
jgi:hypothetical protein